MKKYLKMPLFWSTVVLGLTTAALFITVVDLTSETDMQTQNKVVTTLSSSSTQSVKIHGMGTKVLFPKSIEVSVDDLRLDFEKTLDRGNIPVVVKVTIKNNGTEPFDWSPLDFEVWDKSQQSAYPTTSTLLDVDLNDIQPGESYTAELLYGMEDSGPYIVSYNAEMWSNSIE